MEVELINRDSFLNLNSYNRDKPQEGRTDGDYSELVAYLSWTLENSHSNPANLKEGLKVLTEKFGICATKQFLSNQMQRKCKVKRINYLLKNLSLTSVPINKYFYSTIYQKAKLHQFGTERSYYVGHTYNKLCKEQLDLIVSCQQQEQKAQEIKIHFDELEQIKPKRQIGKPLEQQPEDLPKPEGLPETPGIEVSCKRCNKKVKLPLLPDVETDKHQQLAYGIYSALIKNMESGIKFCAICQAELEKEGLWKTEAITNWLEENKGACFRFSVDEFCNDFRNDRSVVSPATLKHKLETIMPLSCKVEGDKIKIDLTC